MADRKRSPSTDRNKQGPGGERPAATGRTGLGARHGATDAARGGMLGGGARRSAKREPAPPSSPIPSFDPAVWVGYATARAPLDASAEALRVALTDEAHWAHPAGGDRDYHELIARLASALRPGVALYAMTAALVAPYLSAALSEGIEFPLPPIEDNLVALLERRHADPAASVQGRADDPWLGLAEWLWSHAGAWAAADLAAKIGATRIRDLTPEEYQRRRAAALRRTDQDALRERLGHLLLAYAQEFARSVVESLELPSVGDARRALLLSGRPADPAALLPTAPPARVPLIPLVEEHLRVVNVEHYHALRAAIYKNTFARVAGQPWPTADLRPAGVDGQALLRPPTLDSIGSIPAAQVSHWAAAMWRHSEELSDLDADALDALCAIYLYQARTPHDRAVADVDGLLAMRGIQPRRREGGSRSGYETEQRQEMMRAVARIQNLWVTVAEEPAGGDTSSANGQGGRRAIQSPAFVITSRVGQLDLSGEMVDVERFVFRPGEVFGHYILGPGSRTVLLSARALAYDTYRQIMEKRLARHFSWQWGALGAAAPEARTYTVQALLDAIGKSLNPRRAAPLRERLEQALDTLKDDGVIAAWHYLDWDEGLAARRGWADAWLASRLQVTAPRVVRDDLVAMDGVPLRPPPAPAGAPATWGDLVVAVKDRRFLLGLAQGGVAAYLGVSQSFYSRIERGALGEAQVRPELRERLAMWLREHPVPGVDGQV